MTNAGPVDLIDDENSDVKEGIDEQTKDTLGFDIPGALPNHGRPVV
ncbi:periodic tryptophan protein 2-like protein [Iris pallida]|uniref:Periodic tryptophan protein 2-like protein n=1 Tax=Iris pallida TaxID=29817 RepID=A0AAX6GGC4_IRIPA|nr:periodic tryptophan protein 2-like protein [Iris pallida]